MLEPRVSIIIPHWNGIEVLSECLDSLEKTTYPNLEIIVVDNASSDGSQDWVSLHYPNIKLIENNTNLGYAGGCNKGAEACTGDYLVFLNNDTIHENNWIETLADFLNLNSEVSAVQPKILNHYEQNKFDLRYRTTLLSVTKAVFQGSSIMILSLLLFGNNYFSLEIITISFSCLVLLEILTIITDL